MRVHHRPGLTTGGVACRRRRQLFEGMLYSGNDISSLHVSLYHHQCGWFSSTARRFSRAPQPQGSPSSPTPPPPVHLEPPPYEAGSDMPPDTAKPPSSPSFSLWSPFIRSSTDLHEALLLEAHEKHGVDLNVPPQIPPELSSSDVEQGAESQGAESHTVTEVDDVVDSVYSHSRPAPSPVPTPQLPPAMAMKMREPEKHYLYRPTHNPPPLHTTGSRALVDAFVSSAGGNRRGPQWEARQRRIERIRREEWLALWERAAALGNSEAKALLQRVRSAVAPTEEETTGSTRTAVVEAEPPHEGSGPSSFSSPTTAWKDPHGSGVLRAPVKPDMLYHCGVCGRGYRQRDVAEEHVALRHPEETKHGGGGASRLVLDGPGPGEILAIVTDASAPVPNARRSPPAPATATATAPAAAAASGEPGAGAVRATPEGAARSLKRRLTSTSGAAATAKKGGGSAVRLSIKEMSQMFPNPFGAAADAAAEAAKLEEKEPVNPFSKRLVASEENPPVVDATGLAPDSSSSAIPTRPPQSSSAVADYLTRPESSAFLFRCPLCKRGRNSKDKEVTEDGERDGALRVSGAGAFSCRLLDRLFDHLDEVHAEEGGVDAVDPETLAGLYDQQRYPWKYAKQKEKAGDVVAQQKNTAETPLSPLSPMIEGDAVPHSVDGADRRDTTGSTNKGRTSATTATLSSTPSMQDKDSSSRLAVAGGTSTDEVLRLHSRLLSSVLLRGEVMDVQQGYAQKQMTLQYVVKVIGREASAPLGDEKSSMPTEYLREENEMEYIVVRYTGEASSFSTLRNTIRVGCDVFVIGLLRLDRRVDSVSKRYHAYPIVSVSPPYGVIRALS